MFYAIDDFSLELALLERGSSRRTTVMRSRPANIRVIHRRCRSADQLTGSQPRARPDGWASRACTWTAIEETKNRTTVSLDTGLSISEPSLKRIRAVSPLPAVQATPRATSRETTPGKSRPRSGDGRHGTRVLQRMC